MKDKARKVFGVCSLVAAFLLSVSVSLSAQDRFKLAEDSKVSVKGTSSLHDWETKATQMSGTGVIEVNEKAIESVNNFQLSIPVKSLESGKKGLDNKVYEALKADKSPKIEFQIKNISQDSPGKITVNGRMTIAGKTKDVQIASDYKVDNGNILVNGSHTMKMTEFDVDPPTAMLGAVRAGDQIQIEYSLILINETNSLKTSK